MATFKCAVCGGTYSDPQTDGSSYFHACPPLSAWEVLALGAPAAIAAGYPASATFDQPSIDAVLIRTPIARPGARNENVRPGLPATELAPGQTLDTTQTPQLQPNPPRVKQVSV